MPDYRRSFNPYSVAARPPSSIPDYTIDPTTIVPLTNKEAGRLIDAFLQNQDGKILTLHRLADHLLGRRPVIVNDKDDVDQLEDALEEERRRDAGVLQFQPEVALYGGLVDDENEEEPAPAAQVDKKKSRKEERRLKKEKERAKRKSDAGTKRKPDGDEDQKSVKKRKSDQGHDGHRGQKH
jgi:hypothetical protein